MTAAHPKLDPKRKKVVAVAAVMLLAGYLYLRHASTVQPDPNTLNTSPDTGLNATDGSLAGSSGNGSSDGSSAALAAALDPISGSLADIQTALANMDANQQSAFDAFAQGAGATDFAPLDTGVPTTDSTGAAPSTGHGDGLSTFRPVAAPGNARATAVARAGAAVRRAGIAPHLTTAVFGGHLERKTPDSQPPRATLSPTPIPVNRSPAPAAPVHPLPARAGAIVLKPTPFRGGNLAKAV